MSFTSVYIVGSSDSREEGLRKAICQLFFTNQRNASWTPPPGGQISKYLEYPGSLVSRYPFPRMRVVFGLLLLPRVPFSNLHGLCRRKHRREVELLRRASDALRVELEEARREKVEEVERLEQEATTLREEAANAERRAEVEARGRASAEARLGGMDAGKRGIWIIGILAPLFLGSVFKGQ